MLCKRTLLLLSTLFFHALLMPMNYISLFERTRNPLMMKWSEATKSFIYTLLRPSTRSQQPTSNSVPDGSARLTRPANNLAQTGYKHFIDALSTDKPPIPQSPQAYAACTNFCVAALYSDKYTYELRTKALSYLQLLGIRYSHIPALQYLAACYKHAFTTIDTHYFQTKECEDAIQLIEAVLALVPTLPLNGERHGYELLSDAAYIITHLQTLPHNPMSKDHAQLCYARCSYHANKQMQNADPARDRDSWQICHSLFANAPHDPLAGIYSVIIPLFARELSMPTTIAHTTPELYAYLDTTLDQLEKHITPEAAQIACDIFHAELEQLAYHSCDQTKIHTLRLLLLINRHRELPIDSDRYKTDLEKTIQARKPTFRSDIVFNKLNSLSPDIEAPLHKINEYLTLWQHASHQIKQFHNDDQPEVRQHLLQWFISTIIPCMPTIVNAYDSQILTAVFQSIKDTFNSDPATTDALLYSIIQLVETNDTPPPLVDKLVTPVLNAYFNGKQSPGYDILKGLLKLATIHNISVTTDSQENYIKSCTDLCTLIKDIKVTSLNSSLQSSLHNLLSKAGTLFCNIADSTQNSPPVLTNRLLLYEYAIQLQYPHAQRNKACMILKNHAGSHTLPVNKIKTLIAQAIHSLTQDRSIDALLKLSEVYMTGIPSKQAGAKQVWYVEKNLSESYKFALAAYVINKHNTMACHLLGKLEMKMDTTNPNIDYAIDMFTQAIEGTNPIMNAYATRGELFVKKEKYQEAYTDLAHYIETSNILSIQSPDDQDARALWFAGIAHYMLNPGCIDTLVTYWAIIFNDINHKVLKNNDYRNLYLESFISMTSASIIEKLAQDAQARIRASCTDKNTLELCHFLQVMHHLNPQIISGEISRLCLDHALVHKNVNMMIAMLNGECDIADTYTCTRTIIALYHLYKDHQDALQQNKIPRDEIPKMLSKLADEGYLLACLYKLCIDSSKVSASNAFEPHLLGTAFKKLFEKSEPLNQQVSAVQFWMIWAHAHTCIHDFDQAGLLAIFKKIMDDSTQLNSPIATEDAAYITFYYALIYYNAVSCSHCPQDKWQEYFTTTLRHLNNINLDTLHPVISTLKRRLYHSICSTIIKSESNQDSRMRLLQQALNQHNALAYFKLALITLEETVEHPGNTVMARRLFNKGIEYGNTVTYESFEYYMIDMIKLIFLEKIQTIEATIPSNSVLLGNAH